MRRSNPVRRSGYVKRRDRRRSSPFRLSVAFTDATTAPRVRTATQSIEFGPQPSVALQDPGGLTDTPVPRGQACGRLVRVEPAGIRDDPQLGALQVPRLAAHHGTGMSKRGAICGDACNSDDARPPFGDDTSQSLAPFAQLVLRKLACLDRCPVDEVGDADSARHEVGAIFGREPRRSIDLPLDEACKTQRGVEAVSRVGEVGLCCSRPQARVDPNEQQPQFVSTAAGGLPALRFDGKDDFLHNTTASLLESGAPRTVIVVGQVADDTGGALFCFRRGRQAGSSVFTAQFVNIGGKCYAYSDGLNAAGNTTVPPERMTDLRQPFVAAYVSAGTGSKLQVLLNATDTSPQQPGGIGTAGGLPGFTIGSREDIPPSSQIWHGDISEILIYDHALTDQQLQEVGSYLSTRYDLPAAWPRHQLPATDSTATTDAAIITELYYAAFSRPPTQSELQYAASYIRRTGDRRQAFHDLAWALMNAKEFVFQH